MNSALAPLWRASSQEVFEAAPFEGDRTVDLAIVGGGYTGLSAALEASGQGASVTLLESETVGHGGSGRNVGLVNAGLWLLPDELCRTLGDAAGEHLNTVLAAAPDLVFSLITEHAIACEPVRQGTLHLAHAKAGVDQLRDRLGQIQARRASATAGRRRCRGSHRNGSLPWCAFRPACRDDPAVGLCARLGAGCESRRRAAA